MGDSCRQVSWLAARTLRPAFPARIARPVAYVDETRRLQLRGQPRIEALAAFHRVPFSPVRVIALVREPAREKNNQTSAGWSSNLWVNNFVSLRARPACNGPYAQSLFATRDRISLIGVKKNNSYVYRQRSALPIAAKSIRMASPRTA